MLNKWLKLFKKNQENIKDNLGDFLNEEKREINELITGKQSFSKYRQDASKIFKDYFVPSDDNDNRPKILRPKQLTIIALILLLMKIGLVGYLFSVYQETAEMAPTTVSDILVLTNEARVAAGAQPLELNFALNQAAESKVEDMIAKDYFSHTSPDGRKPWNFVNRSAYQYLLVGENLAMNFIGASDAHSALMASPSHQKNILNPKYTHVGFAVAEGKIGGETTNVMVQIFAYKSESNIAVEPVVQKTATATKPAEPVVEVKIEPAKSIVEPVIESSPDAKPIVVAAEVNPKASAATTSVSLIAKISPVSETPSAVSGEIKSSEAESKEDAMLAAASSSAEEIFTVVAEEEFLLNLEEQENILSAEPVYITTTSDEQLTRAAWFMKFSKFFYIGFLLLLILALLINIFVRITVQHKSVIIQTILLIVLITALLLFDFSFMKEIRQAATNIILF